MYVDVNNARLFFDVVGPELSPVGDSMVKRPTFLALHGGPGFDHSTLRPYFDRFSDAFQVVYLDHRGGGRSTGDSDSWHLDQWADDIADFCDTLGIEDPVVFGQSFGGMVAMHYAARYPDKPSKLILSSTTAQFLLEETVKMMRHLGGDRAADTARAFFTTPSLDLFDEYAAVGVHFFQDEMKSMDMRDEIAAITCPTLVMAGALDPVTPPACAEALARAIGANARLEIFEACGHGAYRDHPEAAERVMRGFLNTG